MSSPVQLDESWERPSIPDDILNTAELAEYYGVAKSTIQAADRQGRIPGRFKVLGQVMFDLALAKQWVPSEAVLLRKVEEEARKGSKEEPAANSGNFKKGHKLAKKGDVPRRRRVRRYPIVDKKHAEQYNAILAEELTPDRWRNIVAMAIQEAETGGPDGHRARQWLGNYVMGRPIERIKAEIDLNVRQEFTKDQRADAIKALLTGLRPVAGEIIDVTPTKGARDAGDS